MIKLYDMKLTAMTAASLLILTACGGNNNPTGETNVEKDQVRDSLQQVLAEQDSVIALMTELSDAMQQIKAMEGIVAQTDFKSRGIK